MGFPKYTRANTVGSHRNWLLSCSRRHKLSSGRFPCLCLIPRVCPSPLRIGAVADRTSLSPFPLQRSNFQYSSSRHSTSAYPLRTPGSNQLTRHCRWLSIPALLSLSWFLPTSLWHPHRARNSSLQESSGWPFAIPTHNFAQSNSPALLTTTRWLGSSFCDLGWPFSCTCGYDPDSPRHTSRLGRNDQPPSLPVQYHGLALSGLCATCVSHPACCAQPDS